MPPENEKSKSAESVALSLGKGLAALTRDPEPVLKRMEELAEQARPFIESVQSLAAAAAPFVQAAVLSVKRYDAAESLMARGWVPNSTTPFDLVEKSGDDETALRDALLAHYEDNWHEVRGKLEASVLSRDIDREAKDVFREALDAHERKLYRCVVRLLFPEFERLFRQALFDGKAGQILYRKIIEELTEKSGLDISHFMFAGIRVLPLFGYLADGMEKPHTSSDPSNGPSPAYTPGLYIGVNEKNIEHAKLSPIPTRHAVAHSLVIYSSAQNSLNAIFIADYVFSIISELSRKKADGET